MGESTRFSVIPCLPQKQAKAWTPNPHPGRMALFRRLAPNIDKTLSIILIDDLQFEKYRLFLKIANRKS